MQDSGLQFNLAITLEALFPFETRNLKLETGLLAFTRGRFLLCLWKLQAFE